MSDSTDLSWESLVPDTRHDFSGFEQVCGDIARAFPSCFQEVGREMLLSRGSVYPLIEMLTLEDQRDLAPASACVASNIAFPNKAKELAKTHGIQDAKAQLRLLVDLKRLEYLYVTAHKHKPDTEAWTVPRGRESWKLAHRRLAAFSKRLRDLEVPLRELANDKVMLGAVGFVTSDDRLPQLVKSLLSLARVIQAAAELKSNSGTRSLEPWKVEASEMCRQFWAKHMGGELTAHFEDNGTTKPLNEGSRWFCDVMSVVAGVTVSECRTLLRRTS